MHFWCRTPQQASRRNSCSTDAVVIGSGPNGLAAGITLARAGKSVVLYEAAGRVGGGLRSAELTLPGFTHDICSAVHPLGIASPFFQNVPLADHGLQWVHAEAPLAHPIAEDRAACVEHSLKATGAGFGGDARAYERLLSPFCDPGSPLVPDLLAPLHWPQHPWLLAKFGMQGMRSIEALVESWFENEQTRAVFAGMAAHSMLELSDRPTAAVGLMFAITAHTGGWPFPRGGSEAIAVAMRGYFESLGGTVVVDTPIRSLAQLPATKAILFDVSPRQLVEIAGDELPRSYAARLLKFRHGPGVFKLDWALDGPIPWRATACERAGTVHIGGTFAEVAEAERAVCQGRPAPRPFVLLAQPSRFDSSRAPAGKHTGWAYCHVPPACDIDMTDRIESQVERFAPGFRDLILARHRMYPADFERYNANYIDGDISGGAMTLWQTFARPVASRDPYRTPAQRLFLCSASTPPGPGVHGMCGWHAAQSALRSVLK